MAVKKFFAVNKEAGKTPEILLYGYVNSDEVNAADFTRELKALEADNSTINVRVNSGGGSVFEGLAIYSAIRNSSATVNTYVDGLAASMGSIIALAGDKVYMSNIARMMTHQPNMFSGGNANDLRRDAALVESLENTICAIYAAKAGITDAEAKTKFLSDGDNWMTADEAKAAGLVDEIFTVGKIKMPANAKTEQEVWGAYAKVFDKKFDKNTNMDILKLIAAKLGLNDNASEDEVTAKLTERLNETKATSALKTENDALKMELLNLKAAAEDAKITGLIDTAITGKKIPAGDKEKYIKLAKADFTTTKELIDAMKPYESIEGKLGGAADKTESEKAEVAQLVKMSGRELYLNGNLERLQALDDTQFRIKYKEAFGVEYK